MMVVVAIVVAVVTVGVNIDSFTGLCRPARRCQESTTHFLDQSQQAFR